MDRRAVTLAVDLYGHRVGHLEGEEPHGFTFTETSTAIAEFGVNSTLLSLAIPFVTRQRRSDAGKRRNFFAELLPEGRIRAAMFDAAGIRRADDVVAFLRAYGRDVAGALQIWDVDDAAEPKSGSTVPVGENDVRVLLEQPLRIPLANLPGRGKTSLAGVQPKIVLARTRDRWAQAVDGYPSTHILKPALADRPTVIHDEEYATRVARTAGIAAVTSDITSFAGLPTLVIERYDREPTYPDGRLHQEDFNQILGAAGDQKYQEYGGRVTLRRAAEALAAAGAVGEIRTLASQVVLAASIGNLDMHAKNISVLHLRDGSVRLAPAYDVVPMTHLDGVDGRLALAVGGVYVHSQLTKAAIIDELTSWRLRGAQKLVDETLDSIRTAARDQLPLPDAGSSVQDDIVRITTNLLSGKPAGADP